METAMYTITMPAEEPTLRDQFAMAALQGMLANADIRWVPDAAVMYAGDAYQQANAMMKAREMDHD